MEIADVRRAVYETVHEFPARRGLNNVESAALVLGLAAGTVYNKADPGNDQQGFYVEQAIALMLGAGDFRILHSAASACDHAAVKLGDYRRTSDSELVDLITAEQVAIGRKAKIIRAALADGKIDPHELVELRRAFHHQITSTLELFSRFEGMADAR